MWRLTRTHVPTTMVRSRDRGPQGRGNSDGGCVCERNRVLGVLLYSYGRARAEKKTFFSWRATRVAHKSARDFRGSTHFGRLDGDDY